MTMTLLYHHCRELAHTRYDLVVPWRKTQALSWPPVDAAMSEAWEDALHFEACFRWLAERVGYWPLWLAVGEDDDTRRMTGYQSQWRSPRTNFAAGERPVSQVLFSWSEPPTPTLHYLDYAEWYIVLNSVAYAKPGAGPPQAVVENVGPGYERMILRRSWPDSRWRRTARLSSHTVQAVVPFLDLRTADEIWCRNRAARSQLLALGFTPERVHVRRLRVNYDWQ